jgi:broad specificity phosphatase PhoE
MRERVLAGLHRIAEEHPDGRVLVVTHGGPVRALLIECGLDGRGPIGNCARYEVRLQDGRFVGIV